MECKSRLSSSSFPSSSIPFMSKLRRIPTHNIQSHAMHYSANSYSLVIFSFYFWLFQNTNQVILRATKTSIFADTRSFYHLQKFILTNFGKMAPPIKGLSGLTMSDMRKYPAVSLYVAISTKSCICRAKGAYQ